jgi:hypothetical protein
MFDICSVLYCTHSVKVETNLLTSGLNAHTKNKKLQKDTGREESTS